MKTVLYDYQDKTAKDIFDRMNGGEIKGAYLGFDTGTGKTITSLSVAERLKDADYIINRIMDWNDVDSLDYDWETLDSKNINWNSYFA